jgi:hypothetical protein
LGNRSRASRKRWRGLRIAIRNGTFRAAPTEETQLPALTFGAFAKIWRERRGVHLVRPRDNDYQLKKIERSSSPGRARSVPLVGQRTIRRRARSNSVSLPGPRTNIWNADMSITGPSRYHSSKTGPSLVLDRAMGHFAIEDQQLVLNEHRFGHDGTGAARTGDPGDCRNHAEKGRRDRAPHNPSKIAARARNAHEFWNSPCTGPPKTMHHFAGKKGETIIQVHGEGARIRVGQQAPLPSTDDVRSASICTAYAWIGGPDEHGTAGSPFPKRQESSVANST